MTPSDLLPFLRRHRYAVQATVTPAGTAQAAVVGIAVSDDLEIVFDTLESTRKLQNLRRNPAISLVIGGCTEGDEETVQLDGVADEPVGGDLERLKQVYYATFPDGPTRLSWPGLVYVRVRPKWLRYSNFRQDPPTIVELTGALTR
jgi:general stress protein 26